MNSPSISAVILAGGQSRRMGQDKAILCWDGVPLLRRVYDVAADCVDSVYLLTPWGDRYREILPESCRVLPESQPGNGPLVALLQVLEPIAEEWVWLLGCDLPQLEARVIQTWIDRLPDLPESVLACVPKSEKGWEPLCGFYRKQSSLKLAEFAARGGRSFQQWLAEIPTEAIAVEGDITAMLHNCNRPEDL